METYDDLKFTTTLQMEANEPLLTISDGYYEELKSPNSTKSIREDREMGGSNFFRCFFHKKLQMKGPKV